MKVSQNTRIMGKIKCKMPKMEKTYLFKSYYIPILTYGAETWMWARKALAD
jgi:hypothetical protein